MTLKAVSTSGGGGGSSGIGTLPSVSATLVAGAYTTLPTDIGKIVKVTTGASDATITLLAAATAGANALMAVQKVDNNSVAITGAATNGGLVRLAFTSVPATTTFTTGNLVNVNGMVGVPQNASWTCTSIDTTHIDLQGSTFSGTWTSGGTIKSGKVIVTDGVTTWANLFAASDIVWLRVNTGATAWEVVDWTIKPIKFVGAANATVSIPPLLSWADVTLQGGAGGGGSGRSGLAGVARSGGASGASGILIRRALLASVLSAASYALVVGAPAAGGTAVTATAGLSTDGNSGTAGNPTTWAGLSAVGGSAGGGGLVTIGVGGVAVGSQGPLSVSKSGVNGSITGVVAVGNSGDTGASGPGGCISTGNAAFAGTDGSLGSQTATTQPAVGTGGANTGVNGNNGSDITDTDLQTGGSGGGGGGANLTGAGGTGGNGGTPGTGGAGGGAAVTLSASGAGGIGARGEARITFYFD